MKCAVPGCESTQLIHSGVDAFMRMLPFTGKYCYTCGNAFYFIYTDFVSVVENAGSSDKA